MQEVNYIGGQGIGVHQQSQGFNPSWPLMIPSLQRGTVWPSKWVISSWGNLGGGNSSRYYFQQLHHVLLKRGMVTFSLCLSYSLRQRSKKILYSETHMHTQTHTCAHTFTLPFCVVLKWNWKLPVPSVRIQHIKWGSCCSPREEKLPIYLLQTLLSKTRKIKWPLTPLNLPVNSPYCSVGWALICFYK